MKTLKAIVFALLITIVPVQQSKAAIGLFGGAGSRAIPTLFGGVVGTAAGFLDSWNNGTSLLTYILVYGGLILLEDEGQIAFSKINEAQAKKLGITKAQMDIFNAELDEVNVIVLEVASELNPQSSIEDSKRAWANYTDMLSPETVKTMKAIISQK